MSALMRLTAALCASVMVVMAFQALVGNARADPIDGSGGIPPAGGTPPGPPDSNASGSGAKKGSLLDGGLPELGDPNGTVNETFIDPVSYSEDYANNTIDPYFITNVSGYLYVTSFGNFTFPAAAPYLMSLYDLDERLMANSSTFIVIGDQPTNISGSYVVVATNETFTVHCNVTSNDTYVGFIQTAIAFNSTRVPKVSAEFVPDQNETLSNWHLSWRTITPTYYLRTGFNETLYFGDAIDPIPVPGNFTNAEFGHSPDPELWNTTLWANWSGAPEGLLSVGPLAVSGTGYGIGMMVDFPEGIGFVDPSLVAITSDTLGESTKYTTQKKVFYFDNRYFAFFLHVNGQTPSIRYSMGREVSSSPTPGPNGGAVWSPPVPVVTIPFISGSGADLALGFDVDMRDGVVALAWSENGGRSIYFLRGNVKPLGIVWDAKVTVETEASPVANCPLSVAIGSDGYVWIAASRWVSITLLVWIFRSTSPEGISFQIMGLIPALFPTGLAIRLIPLGAAMRVLMSGYSDGELRWITWTPENGGRWLGCGSNNDQVCKSSGANTLSGTQADKMAATWTRDGKVAVAYPSYGLFPPAFQLRLVYIDWTASGAPVILDSCTTPFGVSIRYPAIQTDLNGDQHIFWVKGWPEFTSYIYYRRMNYLGGLTVSIGLPETTSARWLSTSLQTISRRAFVVYSSPVSSGTRVYFASVPTRQGGGAGRPFQSTLGINPKMPYFSQLSEHVSPMDGLLYVRQTDMEIPGRGLDLSIQRLYRTPDAFDYLGNPWDYESLGTPYYSFGNGWSLNFPWYTGNYLYLWDGQRYTINWDHNRYENKEGEYFLLEREGSGPLPIVMKVYLTTRSGVKYTFIGEFPVLGLIWKLHEIVDATGANKISFNYDQNRRLASIVDTIGRAAAFDYNPQPGCLGYTVDPPKVCRITYGGRTTYYQYAGDRLVTVVSPIGSSFLYTYDLSNDWLIFSTIYPTGARTEYVYSSARSGTELVTYLVVTRRLKDTAGGAYATVNKRTFNYKLVNGLVVFNRVDQYSGESTRKASTLYNLDSMVGSLTTTQFDELGMAKTQQRSWFSSRGVLQEDTYKGTAAISGNDITYSTFSDYDEYGNMVYSRDPLGHETFTSYVNSNNRGSFVAPGMLSVTTPGKIWNDNFRDRDVLDWSHGAYGTPGLDESSFNVLPPSLKISSASTPQTVWAAHSYSQQSSGHVINSIVKVQEPNSGDWISLYASGSERVTITFGTDCYFHRSDGLTDVKLSDWPYIANRWYVISIKLNPGLSSYDLYIDGQIAGSPKALKGSGSINEIRFSAYPWTVMWLNEVAVFKSTSITIGGISLLVGKRVRVLDATNGKKLIPAKLISQGGSVTFSLAPQYFPRIVIQVLDPEWSTVYSSPAKEYWGGSSFDFVEPQFISPMKKQTSGFLRYSQSWSDDSIPNGALQTASNDYWRWDSAPDNIALSGSSYHYSKVWPSEHSHTFYNAPPDSRLCLSPTEYNIQYAYLSSETLPMEIRAGYQDVASTWLHGAYWGTPLDGFRFLNGTLVERWMGYLPPLVDRWAMFVVKQADIAPGTCWMGMNYLLAGGGASWDLTAKGDSRTGQVRVSGVPPGSIVIMQDEKQNTWSAFADGNSIADISVYSTGGSSCIKGCIYPNAFPFKARFAVWPVLGSPNYYSPFFDNIFGGDEFVFTPSENNFYDNGAVPETIRDRVAGVRLPQDASKVQESYFKYDSKGNLVEMKKKGPVSWITASKAYDQYGNVVASASLYDDVHFHTTTYEYKSASPYNSAFLTKVSDYEPNLGWLYTEFDYNTNTGDLTSVKTPNHYGTTKTTSYLYDALSRITRVTNPDGTFTTTKYWDAEPIPSNLIVIKDENYQEPNAKRQTWECYDTLGRLQEIARFGDSGPLVNPVCTGGVIDQSTGYYSKEKYAYNWQGLGVSYTSAEQRTYRKEYDFIGRITAEIAPDLVTRTDTAYDDSANMKTVTVTKNGVVARKIQYLSDWSGRLTAVREFYSTDSYYTTSYGYDYVGNLISVTTPSGAGGSQTTTHTYDVLGRLERTDYPDTTFERYFYFNSGIILKKQDRVANEVTYTYDELKRVKTIHYSNDGSTENYAYDKNGNLHELTYRGVDLDYSYDDRDRMTSEGFTIGTSPLYLVGYTYDNVGNVMTVAYPQSSGTAHYRYDAFDRVCAVGSSSLSTCTPTSGYYAKFTYYLDDSINTITYGDTSTTSYTYNTNGLPLRIETSKNGLILRLDYQDYSALGDPKTIQASGPTITTTTETYSYDLLDRLSSSSSVGQWSWDLRSYAYDALGNRLSVTERIGGNDVTTFYFYDSYSRLCRTSTQSSPTTCDGGGDRYRINGNGETYQRVVGGVTWDFGWMRQSELRTTSKSGYLASYLYDGLGRRVKSTIQGTETHYVFSGISPIFEIRQSQQTKYIYANGMRVARVYGGGTEYYHYDHLGNPRVISTSIYAYRPFGKCAYGCSSEPQYSYTGEYRESDPDLYYLGSRWYDPVIGRFISADDRLGRLSLPQDQNRYAYVLNNPMRYTDPTGHDLLGAIGGVLCVVSIVCGIVMTAIWLKNGASWQEAVGFLSGIALALVVGLVMGALCATGAGCLLGPLAAGMLMGAVVSGSTYVVVTTVLGGTPTWEGVLQSVGWGMVAGGIGAGIGASAVRSVAGEVAAPGENTPEAANTGRGVEFAPNGESKALSHKPANMETGEWLSSIKRVAGDPLFTKPNPSGGKQAFGIIDYLGNRQLTPHMIRVVLNRQGEISDAFIDEAATRFIFGPKLTATFQG